MRSSEAPAAFLGRSRQAGSSVQDSGANSRADLVGQQAPAHGEHGAVAVAGDETFELFGSLEAVPGHARRSAERQRQRLELALARRQLLAAGLGRAPRLDGGDVAVRGAHVPPAGAGAVRVRGRTDPDVVALIPVEVVVAALVTRRAQLEISSQWYPAAVRLASARS